MFGCGNCFYLDKSVIQFGENHNCWRYGCKKRKHIVGWLLNNSGLNYMGCSDFEENKIEQTLFFNL